MALSSRNLLLKKNQLIKAGYLSKNLIFFKRNLRNKTNLNKLISDKKKELNKLFNFKIEYLELRNVNNFKKSKTIKNSKLFVAYYIQNVRLIDNF